MCDSGLQGLVPNGGGSGDTAVGGALPATSTRLIAVRGRARPLSFNGIPSALRSALSWPSRADRQEVQRSTRLMPLLSARGDGCRGTIEGERPALPSQNTIGRARLSKRAENMRGG